MSGFTRKSICHALLECETFRCLLRTVPIAPASSSHSDGSERSSVRVKLRSMKICSLLPSATEILFALGLGDDVAGVSHECDFPLEAKSKPVLIKSRISHTESAAEIDRQVREFLQRGREPVQRRF